MKEQGDKNRDQRGATIISLLFVAIMIVQHDCHRRSQKLVTHPLSYVKTGCPSLESERHQAFLMFTLIDKERLCVGGESFVCEFRTSSVASGSAAQ